MNTFRTLTRTVMAGLLAAGLLVPAAAEPAVSPFETAQASGDCYAIGMQQAAQAGGQLARATAEIRGGQRVCVIVVLMPAKDGQRPRRNEIVVPAG